MTAPQQKSLTKAEIVKGAALAGAIMLFLISPEASNITGATYGTDGGFTTF